MAECQVIKISELAEMLKLSKTTLKRWVDKGRLPIPVTRTPSFQAAGGGTEEMFWIKEDIISLIEQWRAEQKLYVKPQPQKQYMDYNTGKMSFDIGMSLNSMLEQEMEALPDLNSEEYIDITDRIRNLSNE